MDKCFVVFFRVWLRVGSPKPALRGSGTLAGPPLPPPVLPGRHHVQTTTPVTPKLLIIYAQNQESNTQVNRNSAPACLPSNKTNTLTKLKKQLARNSRGAKVMRLVHPKSVLCRPFLALCAPCPAIWARQWGGTKWKFPAMGGGPGTKCDRFSIWFPKKTTRKGYVTGPEKLTQPSAW